MAIKTRGQLKTLINRDLSAGGRRKKVANLTYSAYQYIRDLIDSLVYADGSTNPTATAWDDLRAPFTQAKQGSNLKPDFDETNVGLLFPQNDDTEIAFIIFQLPHSYKLGSDISPHIHWQQMNSNDVVWKFDYKWFDIGDAVPANFTTVTESADIITYTSGNLHQMTEFPNLDGSGISGVSSILLVKVYRDDNVDGGAGGGDALAFEFDIHYQIDSLGSFSEYAKS